MVAFRDVDNVLHTVGGIAFRDANDALQIISAVHFRDADNALQTAYTSGAASVSPRYSNGYANSKGSPRVLTSPVTITLSGIVSPYTIAWILDDPSWDATNTSGASTSFRSPALPGGLDASMSAYATVTDARGAVFTTETVEVSASNFGV